MLAVPGFRAVRSGSAADGPAGPTVGVAGTEGVPAGRPPPLTGSPREQADRLFNRVMQAIAQNDTEQASFFLPMAILAYRQAGELDADGLYHLSVLETASGDAAAGLGTAERILDTAPDHVLALGAAARAAELAGDGATARRHYERLLRVFDAERGKDRAEYRDHAQILPEYHGEATAYLAR